MGKIPAAIRIIFRNSPGRGFAEFHQKFYHPSNAYIFLYGDIRDAGTSEFLRARLASFSRRM